MVEDKKQTEIVQRTVAQMKNKSMVNDKENAPLKKGYKQTEVGVIPEDWKVKTINELVVLMTNGFVGSIKPFYAEHNNGILYIQGYNVLENGFKFKGIKYVTQEFHAKHQKSKLKEGDLLTVQTGDIGVTTVVPKRLEGSNCHALIITRFKQEIINSTFYVYYFNSKIGRNRLKEIETGSTMKHINVGHMKELKIPLPPTLTEQTAIATALSDMDSLIEGLEKLIAKKRNIKQGAMQELLTPKEGWRKTTIDECVNVIGGGTPSSFNSSFWNGDISWFTPTEIGNSKYVYDSVRKITEEGYANSSTRILPIGTVLLTSRAGIGDLGILMKEGCTNQGFQSLVAKDNTDNEFLYYLMTTLKNKLLQNASGSTFLEISPGKLKQIKMSVPSNAEQQGIAEILSAMDTELSELETQLSKYKKLKTGMMQELLTGKKRLV